MLISAVLLTLSLAQAPDAVTAASPEATTKLYRSIQACKDKLESEAPVSARITGEDARLCVWNRVSDHLQLVRVVGGLSRLPGFTVELETRNGVNSQYRVIRPLGYVVLAIKTNVSAGTLRLTTMKTFRGKGGKRTRKPVTVLRSRARSVIYVPFHDDLRDLVLAKFGFKYLLKKVDEAKELMTDRAVLSLVPRGDGTFEWLVTETIPEKALIVLLIIEHIDPSWIKRDADLKPLPGEVERAVQRVLVTYALNGEDAYDYAGSSAGAYGFAQFIKSTYDRVRKGYPAAELLPDFGEGMRDHLNAVVAQYCLADLSLSVLSPEARQTLMDGAHEQDLGAYLAAAYNGGEHYAAPAYEHDAETWDDPKPPLIPPGKLKGKKRTAWVRKMLFKEFRIPADTVVYVREFREVYDLLFPSEERKTPGP